MINEINSYEIFICYESTTGRDYVINLKKALEKDGYKVFLADDTIRAGKDVENEINSALTGCKYFVIVITALSMNSTWVMKEYKEAERLNKRIIHCRYSGIVIDETKELGKLWQLEFENKS
ncbi:MAG: toll/interleukin-1 receptor domain-containing protein, partial [Nitrospinota bacterium]